MIHCPSTTPHRTTPPAGGCQVASWTFEADAKLFKACSPYEVQGSLRVRNNATLTIEPGVELRFDQGDSFEVGSGSPGKLLAEGRVDDRIILTVLSEATASKGNWHGLMFRDGTLPGSAVRFTTVRFAGRPGFGFKGCVNLDDTTDRAVTLEDVTMEDCEQSGLAVDSGPLAGATNLSFVRSDAGLLFAAKNIADISQAFLYTDVTLNRIAGGAVSNNATWIAQSVPYMVRGSIDVKGTGAPVLTIAEGVQLHFEAGEWIEVGDGEDGGLIVAGTPANPVRLGAEADRWRGVVFRERALGGSRIDNAIISKGGQTGFSVRGCVTVVNTPTGRVTVTNSTFVECTQSGVAATESNSFLFAGFSANTFDTSEAGVWLNAETVGSVEDAQTYTNTASNRIAGDPVVSSATWVAQAVPYRVDGSIDVRGPADPVLTINGGVTLQFEDGEWLEIGDNEPGGLIVAGRADAQVVFESRSNAGNAGSWYGIVLHTETLSGTVIDNATVRDAGRTGFGVVGCLTIRSATQGRITVRNATFERCAQSAIGAGSNTFAFASVTANTFSQSAAGFMLEANSVGSVDGVQTYMTTPANITTGGDVDRTATWIAQGVPWTARQSVEVGGVNSPVLTLAAGVEVLFRDGEWLRVGDGMAGGLVVSGTMMSPVILGTSNAVGAAGDWYGLFLQDQTLSGTAIEYLQLSNAGRTGFGVRGGVTLDGTGSRVSIMRSTFSDNAQADVWIDCGSTPSLGENTYATGPMSETGC